MLLIRAVISVTSVCAGFGLWKHLVPHSHPALTASRSPWATALRKRWIGIMATMKSLLRGWTRTFRRLRWVVEALVPTQVQYNQQLSSFDILLLLHAGPAGGTRQEQIQSGHVELCADSRSCGGCCCDHLPGRASAAVWWGWSMSTIPSLSMASACCTGAKQSQQVRHCTWKT